MITIFEVPRTQTYQILSKLWTTYLNPYHEPKRIANCVTRKSDYSCLATSFNRFGGARYYYSWRTAQLCVNGCGEAEMAQYLLISFNRFQDLWYLVRDWICVFTTKPFCISNHFVQFTNSKGCLLGRRSFMQLILLTCVWVLWTESNNRLFIHKENSIDQLLLHNVKIHSYWWIKAANTNFVLGVHRWLSCPLYVWTSLSSLFFVFIVRWFWCKL